MYKFQKKKGNIRIWEVFEIFFKKETDFFLQTLQCSLSDFYVIVYVEASKEEEDEEVSQEVPFHLNLMKNKRT